MATWEENVCNWCDEQIRLVGGTVIIEQFILSLPNTAYKCLGYQTQSLFRKSSL